MIRSALLVTFIVGTASAATAAEPPAKAASAVQTADCASMLKAVMPLPIKFGELMTAVATGMEGHAAWVGASKDKSAKAEAAVLKKLAKDHHAVAAQMKKIVGHLEDGTTIGPVPHDMSKMDPKAFEGMLKQAALEREMAALMIKHADETEKMIAAMAKAAPAAAPAPAPAAKK